jgi:spore maturation protein CgeB
MCGGFYLTQPHPDLAEFYEFGREIETYQTPEQMLEKIRYYLARPEERNAVRRQGLARSLREHTWKARFLTAFDAMGIVDRQATEGT